jgi:hypothetical protein
MGDSIPARPRLPSRTVCATPHRECGFRCWIRSTLGLVSPIRPLVRAAGRTEDNAVTGGWWPGVWRVRRARRLWLSEKAERRHARAASAREAGWTAPRAGSLRRVAEVVA